MKIQDDMLIVGESTELHFDDLPIQNVVRPPTRWFVGDLESKTM